MDDDIIRMAREADDYADKNIPQYVTVPNEWQELRDSHFAALVRADEREKLCRRLAALHDELSLASVAKVRMRNVEYERGFIDGMQKQAQSSVDRAVNRMAEPERHFCERCGKRLSQDGVHTCTPPQQIEQAMLGVWQDVPGAVNFGITGDNNG